MQHTKMRQLLTGGLLTAALITVAATSVTAQVQVAPSLPDNFVGPSGYPNSSTIDYTPFCPPGAPCSFITNPQLTAVVRDGGPGSPAPRIYVNDQTGGGWVSAPIPLPSGSLPDVAVGNDISGSGVFFAAVVALRPTGPANDVFLMLYKIGGVGTGGIGVSGPIAMYNLSGSGQVTEPPHIDIEAQYSNLLGGLPVCDNFAVTWKDNVSGIMGYFASLSAPFPGTSTLIDANTNLSSPDVAAVERWDPISSSYQDWGLFAYVDHTTVPGSLYYQEWQMNPFAAPLGATLYDNTQNYSNYTFFGQSDLRIDAIDDYSQNGPTNAYFDIAISAYTSSGVSVLEYNNITGTFTPTDITAPILAFAGNKNVIPVVACGPGSFYSVGYINFPSMNSYVTSIDWNTGVPSTDPNAYQANMNPWGASPGPYQYGVALSGTANTNAAGTQQLFACWESSGRLWEKYSPTAPPYVFKQSGQQIAGNTAWQMYPNPATDHLTITAPTGYKTADAAGYSVIDMSGRMLLRGTITSATFNINTNSLPAGLYLLAIDGNGAPAKPVKFTKE